MAVADRTGCTGGTGDGGGRGRAWPVWPRAWVVSLVTGVRGPAWVEPRVCGAGWDGTPVAFDCLQDKDL